MASWWVNHSQSWKAEIARGILWAPLTKSDGGDYEPYSNMKVAQTGDLVFSYANGRIGHAGFVDSEAIPSPKPDYASKAPWADEGLLLPVSFVALTSPVVPKDHLERIVPLLASRYAPIQANGNGNLSYLSSISDELSALLAKLANIDASALKPDSAVDSVASDIQEIATDPSLGPTERLQLGKARIGQGNFRKSVLAIEPACRVTGITAAPLLRASHIKPWRDSTNAERLDGANGLMLAPHIDLLFDKFLISFADNGRLLFSPKLEKSVRKKWHLAEAAEPKSFRAEQRSYLAAHRLRLA